MADCIQQTFGFASCQGRKVEADFGGGEVSSDGGLLLLREADRQMGLLKRAAACLPDARQSGKVVHRIETMLRQRVMAIAQGYEDLNDHDLLRHDTLLQTAAGRSGALASSPSLSRFENRADRQVAMALHEVLVEVFIESHDEAPAEVILDFDATDDAVHGQQDGRFFHGYYKHYCFLPLYVFCGDHPLVAWLRPANTDAARGAWLALAWLVKRLRAAWPEVRIIWRADSGFCRWRMMAWSERNGVNYIVGLARNERLARMAADLIEEAAQLAGRPEAEGKARIFGEIRYAAKSWDRPRRVLVKAEQLSDKSNPRYVVTTLRGEADELYDLIYCARGDMENRIKEQQLGLFADRTSCHAWWANQFRLLESTLAYVIIAKLRRVGLSGTAWARAQVSTMRVGLLKIGAVVLRNTRRVVVHLSSSWPYRDTFAHAHARLTAPG
jgi:hypothetical protein